MTLRITSQQKQKLFKRQIERAKYNNYFYSNTKH